MAFGLNAETVADVIVNTAVNSPPSAPLTPGQATTTATPIVVGGTTTEASVVFSASVSDPDLNAVALQVEVQPLGVAFTGTPTGQGGFVASGSTASLTLAGLNGDYHWQYRAVDSIAATSAWTSFGLNLETDLDFRASPPPAGGGGGGGHGGCGAANGATTLLGPLLLTLLVLIVLRRRA